MKLKSIIKTILFASCAIVLGCGGNDDDGTANPPVFETYPLEGVSYSGQTFRQVLVSGLKKRIGGLTSRIDDGSLDPDDVTEELTFYYDFSADNGIGDTPHGFATTPAPMQGTWNAIASGKDLKGKTAGNDAKGQHKDWSTDMVGWTQNGVTTPESLLRVWFGEVQALAVERANGNIPQDPFGRPISKVYVSADGLDYQQLIQKFADGAIAYSQGADDYLDDDKADKGLLSDNTENVAEKDYTALAHAWDEGFGYFGAAKDYPNYTDDEIAAKGGRDGWSSGYHDTNGDGMIDLLSEINFGYSVNAAKRDRGSQDGSKTDYTKGAMDGFLKGRALIQSVQGELTDEQMNMLKGYRDEALQNWERAISATAVHYVNDVLSDMNEAETSSTTYSFEDHAKHWGELKGFSLALQFNPKKQITDAQLAELHQKIGQKPVLPNQPGFADYRTALLEARAILQSAYGFSQANVENW